jgi:GTPase involved in cell partitioning and DNA repair
VRHELESYDPKLVKKSEQVYLTKSDMVSPKELAEKVKALKKIKVNAIPLSILEPESIKEVENLLNEIRKGK